MRIAVLAALLVAAVVPGPASAASPCALHGFDAAFASGRARVLTKGDVVAVCDAKSGRLSRRRHVALESVPQSQGDWVAVDLATVPGPGVARVAYNVATGKHYDVDTRGSHEGLPQGLITRSGAKVFTLGGSPPLSGAPAQPFDLYVKRRGAPRQMLAADIASGSVALSTVRTTGETIAFWKKTDGTPQMATVEAPAGPVLTATYPTPATGRCRPAGFKLIYAAGRVRVLTREAKGVVAICDAKTGHVARRPGARVVSVRNATGPWAAVELAEPQARTTTLSTFDVRTGQADDLQTSGGHALGPDGFVTPLGNGVLTRTPDATSSPDSRAELLFKPRGAEPRSLSTDIESPTATVLDVPDSDETVVYWRSTGGTAMAADVEPAATARAHAAKRSAPRACAVRGAETVYATGRVRVLVRVRDQHVIVCDARTDKRHRVQAVKDEGDQPTAFGAVTNVAGRYLALEFGSPTSTLGEIDAIDVVTGQTRRIDRAASHEGRPFGWVTRSGATVFLDDASFPVAAPRSLFIERPGQPKQELGQDVDPFTVTLREVPATGETIAFWRTSAGTPESATVESAGRVTAIAGFRSASDGRCARKGFGLAFASGRVRVLTRRSPDVVAVCDAETGRTVRNRSYLLGFVGNAAGPWVAVDLQSDMGPGQGLSAFNVRTGDRAGIQSAGSHDHRPDGFVTRAGDGIYTYTPSGLDAPGSKPLLYLQHGEQQAQQLSDDVTPGTATVLDDGTNGTIVYWRSADGTARSVTVAPPTGGRSAA